MHVLRFHIDPSKVNKEERLWSPANIKIANKHAKIYAGRSTTVQQRLFCPHILCMTFVTKTLPLDSSSVSSKQLLCFVQGQGQKANENIRQRTLSRFITIPSINYGSNVWQSGNEVVSGFGWVHVLRFSFDPSKWLEPRGTSSSNLR